MTTPARLAVFGTALLAIGCARGAAQTIDIATTTSVQNSGLLGHLLPLVDLEILFENDRRLLNTYAVIHPSGSGATAFAAWLASADGGKAIAAFTIDGKRAFEPWPSGCAAQHPADLPCS